MPTTSTDDETATRTRTGDVAEVGHAPSASRGAGPPVHGWGQPVPEERGRRARRPHGWVTALVVGSMAVTGHLVADDDGPRRIGAWHTPVTGGERPDPFRRAAAPSGPPTRLRIPAIGVDTPLETLHLGPGGALTPPQAWDRAGWYADGTVPGDRGPAVLAGHVDSARGPAVFFRLRELTAGDRVEVVRGGRAVGFTVVSAVWYPKAAFPADRVHAATPDAQLRLITCGGVFDRRLRSYRDNLVVHAVAG